MLDDKRGKPMDFIVPFGDSLYVFMDIREQKSSIIVTPEESQQITEVGTIISRGDGVDQQFKIGDKVLISYYTGIHLQIKESYTTSKYHRLVREHEILTIIDQEKRDAFNKE